MRGATFRWFAVLASVPFVMVLGNSMLIPVLPAIRSHLNLNGVQTGLIITAFSLPAAVVIPIAGALSDRVGRKPVMVPALILYGLGGILAGLGAWLIPGQFWPVLGARVLQGVGAGGTYQLAMALSGDAFQSTERSRALGLLEASNGLGKLLSPLIGSLAALLTWFAPFFVYGTVAFPAAAGVHWVVPEPDRKGTPSKGWREYAGGLMDVARRDGKSLAASYAAGLVVLFSLFGFLSLFSDELESRFRLSQLVRGLVISVPVGVMAVLAYAMGVVLQRRPGAIKLVTVTGLAATAAALGLLAFVRRPLGAVIAVSALLGLGVGTSLPGVNTLVTSATSHRQRGIVTSLYGTVRFGGVAAGPPLFALAGSETGRLAVFGLTAVITALVAWAAGSTALPDALARRRQEKAGPSGSGRQLPATRSGTVKGAADEVEA